MGERLRGPLRSAAAPLGAAVFAAALYAGTLGHGLVWDDKDLLATVERSHAAGGLAGVATTEFLLKPERHTGYYRPIPLLSLWLDARLARWVPSSFHATNVALHAANTALVLLALRLVFPTGGAAAAAALVFAAHPVHTESVAFVSGRTDLWATFFVLLALVAWLGERGPAGRGRRSLQLAGAAAYLLACLSKEVAFVLPVALLAWDALREGRGAARGWWRRNGRWVALWTVALGAVLALRWAVAGVGLASGGAPAPVAEGHGSTVASALGIPLQYLRLLTIPWPLNALYLPSAFRVSAVSCAGAALLAAICIAADARGGGRAGAAGFAWVAVFLAPVSGVVALSAATVAERFLYLPSFGLSLAVAGVLSRGTGGASAPRLAVTGAAVAAMSAGTLLRAAVWKDEVSLYQDIARRSPQAAVAHFNLGNAFSRAGRAGEAIAAYREAVRLKPDDVGAYNNLGTAYRASGKLREAAASYEAALRHRPDAAQLHYNLANVQADLGDLGAAIQSYRRSLALDPRATSTRYNLAVTLAAAGDRAAALGECEAVARTDPRLAATLRRAIEGR